MEIKLIGLEGIPLVKSGDDISAIIKEAILKSDYELCDGDIILIDEVLSVGDEHFKKKSSAKMKELISDEISRCLRILRIRRSPTPFIFIRSCSKKMFWTQIWTMSTA